MKKYTSTRLAQIWCELNCWKIPKEMKKLKLNKSEAWGVMKFIETLVSKKEINKQWDKM